MHTSGCLLVTAAAAMNSRSFTHFHATHSSSVPRPAPPAFVAPRAAGSACSTSGALLASSSCSAAPCVQLRGVQGSRRRLAVLCMAHPRRVAKVAAQIQREMGNMLISDQVVINALSPERLLGEDRQLSVVPSITHVYVSNDLQVVKVYISIYSDDFGKKRAMSNLKRLEPYVRKEMGQRVPLRLTPEYRFEYDDTLDEMELVQKVIGEKDLARYKRELAEEYGEDEVEDEEEEALAAAPSDAGKGKQGGKGRKQKDEEEDGFFALDDYGEQEYEEYSSNDVFNRPGPFDDLFSGDGDQLVQSVSSSLAPEQPPNKGRGSGGKMRRNNSGGRGSSGSDSAA